MFGLGYGKLVKKCSRHVHVTNLKNLCSFVHIIYLEDKRTRESDGGRGLAIKGLCLSRQGRLKEFELFRQDISQERRKGQDWWEA